MAGDRNDQSEPSPTSVPGVVRSADVPHVGSPTLRRIGTRIVHIQPFDTLFSRGGIEDDTLLLHPVSLVVADSNAYVFDGISRRITAFDARTGELRWRFGGKGGGPGEFGGMVTPATGDHGRLHVADAVNQRITEIGPDGILLRESHPTMASEFAHMCPLSNGSALMVLRRHDPPGVLQVNSSGERLRLLPLPWADLDTVAPLALQARMVPAGDGGSCIFALGMGRGFARMGPEGVAYTAPYIENFELAQTVSGSQGENVRATFFARGATQATFSFSVDSDTLVVHFIGPRGEYHERFLDHYDARTGRYLYSRVLDERAIAAVRTNGIYYVLTVEGDYPSFTALEVLQ